MTFWAYCVRTETSYVRGSCPKYLYPEWNQRGTFITETKRIAYEAWRIITDPKANRIERIEALKLIAATKGLLLPDVNEQWLSVRQVAQLRRIKQQLVEKALARRERKKKANRRQYLRKRIAELEQKETIVGTN